MIRDQIRPLPVKRSKLEYSGGLIFINYKFMWQLLVIRLIICNNVIMQ